MHGIQDVNLTTIMYYSLLGLAIQMIIIWYMMPFKIYNDPKLLFGPFYLCDKNFWRNCKQFAKEVATVDEAYD